MKHIYSLFFALFLLGCSNNTFLATESGGVSKNKAQKDVFLITDLTYRNKAADFSINGDKLTILPLDKKSIQIFDIKNNRLLKEFSGYIDEGLQGNINSFDFDDLNNNLLVGGVFNKVSNKVGNIKIYNYDDKKIIKTLAFNTTEVKKVLYSKDYKYIIGITDKDVYTWINNSFIKKVKLNFEYPIVDVESFENDGKQFLVIATKIGDIQIIDLKNGEILKKSELFDEPKKILILDNEILVLGNTPFSSIVTFDKKLNFKSYNILEQNNRSLKLKNLNTLFSMKKNRPTLITLISTNSPAIINDLNKINNIIYLIVNEKNLVSLDLNTKTINRIKNFSKSIIRVKGDKKNIFIQNSNNIISKIDNSINSLEQSDSIPLIIKKNIKLDPKLLSYELNNLSISNELNSAYMLSNNNIVKKYLEEVVKNAVLNYNINKNIITDNEIFIFDNYKLISSLKIDPFLSYGILKDEIIVGHKNGLLNFYNFNGKLLKSFNFNSEGINFIYHDKNFIITVDKNGIIKLFDKNNEKLVISMAVDQDNEFIMWTEEGYFTVSSPKALKYITWHMNQGYDKEAIRYDIGKFYDVFFRPDLVKLKLQGKDISKYTKGLTVKDALKNPPPEVKITKVDTNEIFHKNNLTYIAKVDTKKDSVNVKFNVSDFGGGIGTIRVYQEGKLIKTIGKSKIEKIIANIDSKIEEKKKEKELKEYKQLVLSKAVNGKSLKINDQISNVKENNSINNSSGDYEIDIPLKRGVNQISIEAFNKTNTITSFRSTVNINADIPKRKPKLYAIVAGVNNFESSYGNNLKNLNYAVNDAKAIKEITSKTKGKIFNEVEIIHLSDNKVTKKNIVEAFKSINKKASLEDTIVFYISTHGISANGKFYLIPSNNAKTSNLIEFQDIFKKSTEVKSLNQIFIIDACQSGSANDIASAVYDSRASVLARSSGIHLLSASTSGTNAFENDKYKHSNFTYEILEAVKSNKTDENKDGFISIIEISDKLKSLDSKEKQFPVIQNFGNDIFINKMN